MERVLLPNGAGRTLAMGGYRNVRSRELERRHRTPSNRSYLVGVVAFALLLAGLLLGSYSLLVPALLGGFLLSATGTFLSMRLNPFAVGFYAGTKPAWLAIGLVLICGLLLVSAAWQLYRTGSAPIFPHGVP